MVSRSDLRLDQNTTNTQASNNSPFLLTDSSLKPMVALNLVNFKLARQLTRKVLMIVVITLRNNSLLPIHQAQIQLNKLQVLQFLDSQLISRQLALLNKLQSHLGSCNRMTSNDRYPRHLASKLLQAD
jgi:hypothetical protein